MKLFILFFLFVVDSSLGHEAPPTTLPPCTCLNGGSCYYSGHSSSCSCPWPYTGHQCDSHFCDVMNPACYNGGTCIKEPHGFTCNCGPFYTGQRCENAFHIYKRVPAKNRVTRDLQMDEDFKALKKLCVQNKLKAKRIFSDEAFTEDKWQSLHPAIRAVLIDLVANGDHRKLPSTLAQIKNAVEKNDLMKMYRIMAKRSLWKRVPVARYWKRKLMMKKVEKTPLKSLDEDQATC